MSPNAVIDAQGVFAVFGPWMVAAALILARLSGMFATAPFFSAQTIPIPVKMGLVGILTVFVMIRTGPVPLAGDLNALRLIGLCGAELLLGGLMGTAATFLFAAIAMAGQLVGTQMGFSMANMMDPTNAQQSSLMGQVLNILALLLYLVMDGHLMMLRALFESFQVAPLTEIVPRGGIIVPELVRLSGEVFSLGLRIAFPVVVCVMFVNIGLAIVARTVPQVNVFQLGFIITVGAGILVLSLSIPSLRVVLQGVIKESVVAAMLMARAC